MTRRSGTCLLALTAALMAQQVSAQTAGSGAAGSTSSSGAIPQIGNIGIELTKVNDTDYPRNAQSRASVPVGIKGCMEGKGKITVTLRGLLGGSTLPYLEAWLGTANNCEQGDRSSRTTGVAVCTQLTIANPNESQVANRSTYSVTVDLGPACDSEGQRPIYFLQLASRNSNATATSYGVLGLVVDLTPPPAPANAVGGEGQTVIPLTWTPNTIDTIRYHVVADWGSALNPNDNDAGMLDGGVLALDGVNPKCPSDVVRSKKGLDLSAIPRRVFHQQLGDSPGTSSFNFNGMSFGGAKYVAAAVFAEDLAGNTSPFSDAVCLTVSPTTGFWERYHEDVPDAVGPGCACSAPGAPGAHRSVFMGLPVLLVLGWGCARSRTRRRAR